MPNYIIGNLWDSKADVIAVTTNGVLRHNTYTNLFGNNYKLVMGAGAALECKNRYPNIPEMAAIYLQNSGDLYNFVVRGEWPKMELHYLYGFFAIGHIGLFQTKMDYRQKSTLDLIEYSVNSLNEFLSYNTTLTVAMNFPAIGFGGLPKQAVQKITDRLNDRVSIFSLK